MCIYLKIIFNNDSWFSIRSIRIHLYPREIRECSLKLFQLEFNLMKYCLFFIQQGLNIAHNKITPDYKAVIPKWYERQPDGKGLHQAGRLIQKTDDCFGF